jgi:hypothetical protein
MLGKISETKGNLNAIKHALNFHFTVQCFFQDAQHSSRDISVLNSLNIFYFARLTDEMSVRGMKICEKKKCLSC